MLRVMFVFLVLSAVSLAQSSTDGSFSVRHSKDSNFSLSPSQIHEAESIYRSACAVVQHDFHIGAGELHPRLTVVIGAERNEVHSRRTDVGEIWMKKWNPVLFAQGVVVLAFDQVLTRDVITKLGDRAVRYSDATVDVSGFR
jgi:hypothetical protein